jgi:hypothetical protein
MSATNFRWVVLSFHLTVVQAQLLSLFAFKIALALCYGDNCLLA